MEIQFVDSTAMFAQQKKREAIDTRIFMITRALCRQYGFSYDRLKMGEYDIGVSKSIIQEYQSAVATLRMKWSQNKLVVTLLNPDFRDEIQILMNSFP